MALGARPWGRYLPMVFRIGIGVLPGCGADDPETGTEPRAARGAPEFTVPAWDPLALDAAVDQVVAEAMAARSIPGVSLTILHRGRPLLSRGYGVARMAEGVPADSATVYRVGSISKQFTSAALLRRVEEGTLGLDDPVTSLLAGTPPSWAPVRLRHLLGMTSGIPDFLFLPGFGALNATPTGGPEDLLAMVAGEPPVFAPGHRWAYSNTNFTLAARILEAHSGRDYGEALADAFFRPLKLTSLHHCRQTPGGPGEALGYGKFEGHVVPAPSENMELARGDGGLCGNALDLARWMEALVEGRAVGVEAFQRMITPDPVADGTHPPYGLSLSLVPLDGTLRKVAHHGAMMGFTGMLAHYPDHGLTVALLTNLGGIPADVVEEAVTRAVLGIPSPDTQVAPLDPGSAARWVGDYDTGVFPLRLVAGSGGLALDAPSPVPTGPLLYLGGGRFALESEPLGVSVELFDDGSRLVLRMAGMQWFGTRIEDPRRPSGEIT